MSDAINVGGAPASLEQQFAAPAQEGESSWLLGFGHFPDSAGGPELSGGAVGTAGVSGAASSSRGAVGAIVASDGLAGSEVGARNAIASAIANIGTSGSGLGAEGAAHSSIGSLGVSGSAAGLRNAISTALGSLGLAGESTSTRAAQGSASGSEGEIGFAEGLQPQSASGGAEGFVGATGAASGSRSTSASGSIGVDGSAEGVAGPANPVADDSGGVFNAIADSVVMQPPRRIKKQGSAAGLVGLSGSAKGRVKVTTSAPVDEQRLQEEDLRKLRALLNRLTGEARGAARTSGSSGGKALWSLPEPQQEDATPQVPEDREAPGTHGEGEVSPPRTDEPLLLHDAVSTPAGVAFSGFAVGTAGISGAVRGTLHALSLSHIEDDGEEEELITILAILEEV